MGLIKRTLLSTIVNQNNAGLSLAPISIKVLKSLRIY